MREMKDSGIPWIGEIPKDWSVMPHKRVMYKVKEIQERYNGENILSLTMRGVIVRDLEAGGKMPTSFDGYQKVYPNNLLQCLFDIDVTPRCVGLIRNEGLTSPAYSQFAMYSNGYAPYYDYLLRYMDDRKTLLHLSKNLRSSLTETDFGAIYTCVPSSIEEQQRIAEFLDRKCAEVDEMIALQEQIIEELKAYKQSVVTEVVTKGLNPDVPMKDSGIEWIGQIPEHWEVKRLKQESVFINGFAFDSEDFKIDDGVRVIRIGDIGLKADFENCVRAITNPNILTPYRIENGDILIAMSGATTGKCCIVDEAEEAYINQRVGIIRSDIRKIIYYSLQTPYFMEFVNLNNAGSAQPNISSKAIGEFPILNMPTIEQQAIADYLDEKCADIDSLIQTKLSKIDSLKEYKKSIIYEYVTGKREVE